jgi:hypothetical protein
MSQNYEDEIRSVIKDSFKQLANQVYDDVTNIIKKVVDNYESRLNTASIANTVDNDNYNKVSMITKQDKEIVSLKARISDLERELRSKTLTLVNTQQPLVLEQPLPVEVPVVVVEKKTRAKKVKEVNTEEKPKKTRAKKTAAVTDTATVEEAKSAEPVEVAEEKPVDVTEEKPVDVAEEKPVDVAEEKPTVMPNIDDLDILEYEGNEYFLDPQTSYIYEITPSGDIGSCIGKKNGEKNVFF